MKAIICERYGPPEVLRLKEVDKPVPNDDEILIRVMASSINSADHRTMLAKPFFVRFMGEGVLRPKKRIPGIDMAGIVEQAGKSTKGFSPGDEVYGDIFDSKSGAYAEYLCGPDTMNIVEKPGNVTFEQAASVPVAGLTALQALRDHGGIKDGQKVLVNGASGGVGTFTVILAKHFGAEVAGVCSTRNIELVGSLGADHVIDYTKENITDSGMKFDLIIDVAATLGIDGYRKLLNPGGTGILVGFSSILHMMGIMRKGRKVEKKEGLKIKPMGMARANKQDLTYLITLISENKITPPVEKVYPLEETAGAMRYFHEEHARAKVVISMGEGR